MVTKVTMAGDSPAQEVIPIPTLSFLDEDVESYQDQALNTGPSVEYSGRGNTDGLYGSTLKQESLPVAWQRRYHLLLAE